MRGFLVSALLAAGACATPLLAERSKKPDACLCKKDAHRLAHNFRDTIAKPFNETFFEEIFTENYNDYADGVAELINQGCPNGPKVLGQPTFAGREAFIQGQGSQPPIHFDILKIWYNCDTVTLLWNTDNAGPVTPTQLVTGIIVIEAIPASSGPQPWLIETTYSEFNSGAWMYDVGQIKPNCSASTAASSSAASSAVATQSTTGGTTVASSAATATTTS